MATMVRSSARLRRALAVGAGSMLAVATLLPSSAAADRPNGASGPGVVNNNTRALAGGHVEHGDLIASGWTMSMPGQHPAATVRLTGLVATIALRCHSEKGEEEEGTSTTIVLRFPDALQSFAVNDASWRPTTAPADAQGYQVSAAAGDLCQGSALEPRGDVTYQAMLMSTDTRDPFLMRFHTVDARSNSSEDGGHHGGANVDCSSTTENVHGLAACSAPWTPATRVVAAALPLAPSPVPVPHARAPHGSGGSGNQPPAQGGIPGTSLVPNAAGAPPGPAGSRATPGIPVLMLPAPSQPTVLSPVPLVVPVIDGVNAQVAGALPWKWFLALAIIDLGLIVGVVIRRRHGIDRLGRH